MASDRRRNILWYCADAQRYATILALGKRSHSHAGG
jgi:hypothetical protein